MKNDENENENENDAICSEERKRKCAGIIQEIVRNLLFCSWVRCCLEARQRDQIQQNQRFFTERCTEAGSHNSAAQSQIWKGSAFHVL